jgi:hypothetical protein
MPTTPLAYLALGLAALYLGERALTGTTGVAVSGVGALLCAAALAIAVIRVARAPDADRRRAALRLLVAYAVVTTGLVVYAVPTYLMPGELSPRVRGLFMVGWPVLVLGGLLPAIAMEQALRSMIQAPKLEVWRLTLAARAAVIAVFAVVAFAGANFAASQWNRKIDLSYFKTTKPGEATLELVAEISEPVQALLFYPSGSDVLEDLRAYFGALNAKNSRLAVEVVDQALEPELAKKYKVRNNGSLVLVRGERHESLTVGVDREDARKVLKKLDSEVQERLFKVVRPARVAYLTTGHGERDWSPAQGDKRYGLSDFKNLLESIGFTVKRLGLSEGLGKEVPSDATLVVVAGPTDPMVAGEREALHAYLGRGGRLWVLVDADHGLVDNDLLAPLGVRVRPGLIATDRMLVRVDDKGESPYNFVTTRTSTHPTIKTLNQNSSRMAPAFLGAASLEKIEPPPASTKVNMTMHTGAEAWLDLTANGTFDAKNEKRAALDLTAAIEVERPKGDKTGTRAVVTGDADVIGNGVVRNAGNAYLVLDAAKWLVGDEALAGKVETEEDVPLVHRKDEDTVWFYGTSFLVPAGVLGFGLLLTKRRRRLPPAAIESSRGAA